jgi:hypothetical protein
MCNSIIAEIKRCADLTQVWAALGGGKLRRNRGQAFWRGGNGYSVSLDSGKGLWHDFVTGDGGDVIALVRTVHQCGFRDAVDWLADFAGVTHHDHDHHDHVHRDHDSDWPTDLHWATYFGIAAEALAEQALEELPYWHPERRGLTALLTTIRLGDASLVNEYREWRRRCSEFTSAMAHAGQRSDARKQRLLARWIVSYGETTT